MKKLANFDISEDIPCIFDAVLLLQDFTKRTQKLHEKIIKRGEITDKELGSLEELREWKLYAQTIVQSHADMISLIEKVLKK